MTASEEMQNSEGSEELNLLAAAGLALERWTRVETHLSILFSHTCGIERTDSAHIILASIIGFETRLAVCHAAMGIAQVTDQHRTIWSWLHNRISKGYKKRHEVAHFSLVTYNSPSRKGLELVPFYSPGRFHQRKDHGLKLVEVLDRAMGFMNLGDDLRWFHFEIERHLGKRGARTLPMPDRVRQHLDQTAQTLAGTPPLPPPSQKKAAKKK